MYFDIREIFKVLNNVEFTDQDIQILDEIDKIGASHQGDPSSAMLEVLDPEQNSTFKDNYLEVDYDLSKVLFIATANSLDTIQPALRDRMEIIEITGYTVEEKIEIANKHLIPKLLKNHGLKKAHLNLTKKIIEKVITDYTRESGVRSLEKKISKIVRNMAKHIAMEEEFEADLKRENSDGGGGIENEDAKEGLYLEKRCNQDLKQVVKSEEAPAVTHRIRNINVNDKKFHCYECEYKTTRKCRLEEHKRKHTNDFFQCSECNFKTHAKFILAQHKRYKHETNPNISFSCDECEFKTKYKRNLKNHIKKHTNDLFHCSECDFKAVLKRNLVQHERNKHETDPNIFFYCDECEYKTTSKFRLKEHKRKHTNDLFHCSYCDFKTHAKRHLAQHKRNKHETDPSIFFYCNECDFKTKYKFSLEEHERKHTNDLFHCPECNFETHSRYSISIHKRYKHDPLLKRKHTKDIFKCPDCSFKTHAKTFLANHIHFKHETLRPEDFFYCSECEYRAKQKCNLNKHMKRKHGISLMKSGNQ